MILVKPEQELERKSEWFCGVKFCSKFNVEWENGVWTKIRFLASGFVHMRHFRFDFYSFSIFWIGFFFLNGFPNPFIVRSWSSFLFSQWKFFELYVRTCPAMFFYFVVAIFVTTIWRQNHFKSAFCSFVYAISTEVRAWRHFSLLVERIFLLIRVIKFLITLDLPHSQKWLPHFEIDFYLF